MTLLRRLGNKSAIADKIWPLFKPHTAYIELFFGAGGMFFSKPRAKYNFLNDLDAGVFNLFMVVKDPEKAEKLAEYISILPICSATWKWAKTSVPKDDIEKAALFLFLSNFGLYGKPDTLRIGRVDTKELLMREIQSFYTALVGYSNYFTNHDFRDAFKNMSFHMRTEAETPFMYADPPYLNTGSNYKAGEWNLQDFKDLVAVLLGSKLPFAISEFDNPIITDIAKENGLFITEICERKTLKSRNTEILMTNYNPITYKTNELF